MKDFEFKRVLNQMVDEDKSISELLHFLGQHFESEDADKKESIKPEPILQYDLTELKEVCEEYLKNPNDDDIQHYIFETALETIYGKDIWEYVNEAQGN